MTWPPVASGNERGSGYSAGGAFALFRIGSLTDARQVRVKVCIIF